MRLCYIAMIVEFIYSFGTGKRFWADAVSNRKGKDI